MSLWPRAILALFWPPAAPVGPEGRIDLDALPWWRICCGANVLPIAAALHHVVFYRPSCMLNPFGADYTPTVVRDWLVRDPSLPWALALSLFVYVAGKRFAWVRAAAAPVFLSFLPLTVWIWDIPFAGRVICDHFHDNKVRLPEGLPGGSTLGTRHFYVLGLLIYALFLPVVLLLARRRGRLHAPDLAAAFD